MVFTGLSVSAYHQRKSRSTIPRSLNQLLGSPRMVDHLLKEIYGHEDSDVESIRLRILTSSGVTGNLSDSGRIELDVELTGNRQTVRYNWFVKVQPAETTNSSELNIFQNEIEVYKKILPDMREFLTAEGKEAGLPEFSLDVPEILYAKIDEANGGAIIVLRDVIADGYSHTRDENGKKFLTVEKAVAAVQSIARIHAVSSAFQQKRQKDLAECHPTLAESGLFWTQADMTARLGVMKESYMELLKLSGELDSPLLLKRFQNSFSSEQSLRELCEARCKVTASTKTPSLQHGDFHFNNLLFKEDSEGRLSVMIVDWQLAYSGRPTGDLAYLLMSSLSQETRELYEEDIKSEYFSSFTNTLNSLVSNNCEKKKLDAEYQDSLPLSFFLSCGNIMSGEEEEECVKFSYDICKEACEKLII